MIIFFNPKGALVAFAGILFGSILLLATQSFIIGIGTIVGIWCWFGRAKTDEATGLKRVAGSVFFVPMFYWGLIGSIALLPAALADVVRLTVDPIPVVADPRAEKFQADEAGLDTNRSDDSELSKAIFQLLDETMPRCIANVRIKKSDDALLVLIRLEKLRDVSDTDRKMLLSKIQSLADDRYPDLKAYVGIKGTLVYGAIVTSGRVPEVGTMVEKNLLYPFYLTSGSHEGELSQASDIDDEASAITEQAPQHPGA